MPFSLSNTDAIEWLRQLPDESVDLLLTDPAYESLEKHRAVGTTTRLSHSHSSSNDWFAIFPNCRFPSLFTEAFRVLRQNRHLYIMCDQETAFLIKSMGEAAGFKFWKPIIWDKISIGMGYHYRARYEFVLFFEKGKRRLNNLSIPDILSYERVRGGYPTEKPVPLLRTLIEQSTSAGEVVADPFFGSGSSGEAALLAGRHYLGADTSAVAVELARTRLSSIPNAVETPGFINPTNQALQRRLF